MIDAIFIVMVWLLFWRVGGPRTALNYFLAIADERHFGRAAARLGLSQPPLSQALRRLEQRVGTRLFERNARGVELTEAGSELLAQARVVVAAAERFDELARRRQESASDVRIGVVPALPASIGAAFASAVRRAGGGRVQVRHDTSVALVERVLARRLDVAVVRHPSVLASLECGPVLRIDARVLVPERCGGPEGPRSAALRELPLAAPARAGHPAAHDLLVDGLVRRGLSGRTVLAEDDRTALVLVASEEAFMLTTDRSLSGPGAVPGVLPGGPVPLRFRAVWHRAAPPPDRVSGAIEDVLRGEAAAPGAAG